MSQKKPVRQEYIVKVRYSNSLPPIPLNPKYLKYNTTENVSPKEEDEQLMASMFRKQNFKHLVGAVDDSFGMSLNLLNNQGYLEEGNSAIYKLGETNAAIKLYDKDRSLLRDPGVGNVFKSEPEVSFLRRTEYISERQQLHKPVDNISNEKPDEKLDSEDQLNAVEETFAKAHLTLNDLSKLQHPRKKNLKAVATWPLLPDTSMMDVKLEALKFVGSASIERERAAKRNRSDYDEEHEANVLKTAILQPISNAEGEWMSLYKLNNQEQAKSLDERMRSTEKERPVGLLDEDEDTQEYNYKFHKNYDLKHHRFDRPNEELAIQFVSDHTNKKRVLAYYTPISGRIELKKYRLSNNAEVNRYVDLHTMDEIDFKLREPNTNELKRSDKLRSMFDPIQYAGDEENDDEKVEEEVGDTQEPEVSERTEVKGNDDVEEDEGNEVNDHSENGATGHEEHDEITGDE